MSGTLSCLIPADPDISGVGVRAAIYAQNLLSFIPAIWALWDGEVSDYEPECVETQSTTILVTAFAILISAMVQANRGLSAFHASIVLALSWMNNTNTFIYFLLYVHHKSQSGPHQIDSTALAWIKHLRDRLAWPRFPDRNATNGDTKEQPPEKGEKTNRDPATSKSETHPGIRQQLWFKAGFRRIVLVLGSLHLSLMAGLGIWLWSDPRSFGTLEPCVTNAARTVILGRSVPLRSTGLRGWSIAIYSLFLMPGFNLILPMALFLGLFLGYHAWNQTRQSAPWPARSPIPRAIRAWYNRLPATPSVFPTIIGLTLLFATNLIFLVDIEFTLRRNRAHQSTGESEWTFGQTLAILLLVLPVRDLAETILARREKKRQDELVRREKQRRDEHVISLQNAIRDDATIKTILDLIDTGADVNTKAEGCDYPAALILAASRGDVGFVNALLMRGAAPNITGGKRGSALAIACANTHSDVVTLLLQHGADPNFDGDHGPSLSAFQWNKHPGMAQILLEHGAGIDLSDSHIHIYGDVYGTTLQAASYMGNRAIVELLLDRGADVNLTGGHYGTALQAASLKDSTIVELLLERGADLQLQAGYYGTALQAASHVGNLAVVKLLIPRGADINIQGGHYGTALQAAACSSLGNVAIIELFVERGADINIQGGMYGTALQAAARAGNLYIVEALLEQGAEINIQGGTYDTALQAASYNANIGVVELLLDHGADVNMQGGKLHSALQTASYRGHLAVVEILLTRRADVNMKGGTYGTALQAASSSGSISVVEVLLQRGAEINTPGGAYGTALRAAVLSTDGCDRKTRIQVVKLLLSCGADPNIEGGSANFGSLLVAARFRKWSDDLFDLLRAHGAI
ncbi:ankyrin repeat-containing domain protein [Mycena vitilis]|nr:ankyrin repeat-containing domain protein [Mycena vitilis]